MSDTEGAHKTAATAADTADRAIEDAGAAGAEAVKKAQSSARQHAPAAAAEPIDEAAGVVRQKVAAATDAVRAAIKNGRDGTDAAIGAVKDARRQHPGRLIGGVVGSFLAISALVYFLTRRAR